MLSNEDLDDRADLVGGSIEYDPGGKMMRALGELADQAKAANALLAEVERLRSEAKTLRKRAAQLDVLLAVRAETPEEQFAKFMEVVEATNATDTQRGGG